MKINLKEVPEDGQNFTCSQNTGELNEALRDLIGNSPYKAELFIRPLGQSSHFEVTGSLKTESPEACSRCGLDFKVDLDQKFKELLLPALDQPRNSKYTKPNNILDLDTEGPSSVEYQGHHFDAGEYLHGVVAIALPLNPAPPEDKTGKCSVCGLKVRGCTFGYEDKGFEKPANPFAELKDFKPKQ